MAELDRQELERPNLHSSLASSSERTRYKFDFEGEQYDIEGPTMTDSDFSDWFSGYAAKTPRCACCRRVFIPGQPVTVGHVEPDDSGYSHLSDECNSTAAGFAGGFNSDGELVSPWKDN